jgi:hypothetical protein
LFKPDPVVFRQCEDKILSHDRSLTDLPKLGNRPSRLKTIPNYSSRFWLWLCDGRICAAGFTDGLLGSRCMTRLGWRCRARAADWPRRSGPARREPCGHEGQHVGLRQRLAMYFASPVRVKGTREPGIVF